MRIRIFLSIAFTAICAFSSFAQDLRPTDSLERFSPFDFGQILSVGLSLSYFHYNEDVDLSDDIQSFTSHYGSTPLIIGAPKSTEYGTDAGISASGVFYSWRNHLFIRPRAELMLGLNNTYDGSTQGEPVVDSPGDTTGIQFFSFKGQKNNFFLFAGCDAGFSIPFFKSPVVLYLGLDYAWWYRDLIMTQDGTYYFGTASNVETYTRWSVPLGLLCVKPVSSETALGFDARADWMFFGTMKATVTNGSSDSTVDFPTVTLGNYPSFRIELFVQKKINDRASMKFSPYFVYYGFGKSNTALSTTTSSGGPQYREFLEPSSRSFWVGCTVSLDFLGKRF